MTTLNSYVTLIEYKAWKDITTTDATDDTVLESILKAASRIIDSITGRHFYPYIETRYFNVPSADDIDPRLLKVDDDLLDVISITNGDGVTIPSTEYNLRPKNNSPHTGIRLIDNSTYYWASDGAGDTHDVIAVNAVWGYHNKYGLAWLVGSTASEAMDTSETGLDVVSNSAFAIGNIIKFDNELGYVSALPTNSLTITRGENGSTAATHETGINVYIWQTQDDIKEDCYKITSSEYQKRSGQNATGRVQITGAGLIISPEGIPTDVFEHLLTYRDVT